MTNMLSAIAPYMGLCGLLWAITNPLVTIVRYRKQNGPPPQSKLLWIVKAARQECYALIWIDVALHFLVRSEQVSDLSVLLVLLLVLFVFVLTLLEGRFDRVSR